MGSAKSGDLVPLFTVLLYTENIDKFRVKGEQNQILVKGGLHQKGGPPETMVCEEKKGQSSAGIEVMRQLQDGLRFWRKIR